MIKKDITESKIKNSQSETNDNLNISKMLNSEF